MPLKQKSSDNGSSHMPGGSCGVRLLSENSHKKRKKLCAEVAKIYSKNASLMMVLLSHFRVLVYDQVFDKCQARKEKASTHEYIKKTK